LLTFADLDHSEIEERWFWIGAKIRITLARKLTQNELRQYEECL
jgi:uncharacterized DUF497 family protein